MSRESRLEKLGQEIMAASVTAEFLSIPFVVDMLDQAFDQVVRVVLDERREGEREEEAVRVAEAAVLGG